MLVKIVFASEAGLAPTKVTGEGFLLGVHSLVTTEMSTRLETSTTFWLKTNESLEGIHG